MVVQVLIFGTWNLELGIWNLELGIWNLELSPRLSFTLSGKTYKNKLAEMPSPTNHISFQSSGPKP
jgi:hypothetical protein